MKFGLPTFDRKFTKRPKINALVGKLIWDLGLGLFGFVRRKHNLPNVNAIIQIMPMAVFARPVVDLNLSGKQMAYHRSTEIKVSVRTETVTDTV